jgi:hypothetical protein
MLLMYFLECSRNVANFYFKKLCSEHNMKGNL